MWWDVFMAAGLSLVYVWAAVCALVAALLTSEWWHTRERRDVAGEVNIFTEHSWPAAQSEPFRFTQETYSRCDAQGWEVRYKVLIENGEATLTHVRMRWVDDAADTWREIPVKLLAAEQENARLREVLQQCKLELAYLMTQTNSQDGGSVHRAYSAAAALLDQPVEASDEIDPVGG